MSPEALPKGPEGATEEELLHGGKVMSIWDHLGELRSRIVRSLGGIVLVFAAAFAFADQIIIFLKQPLLAALPKEHQALHFTGPLDVFLTQIKVGVLAGFVGGSPIWLYQFWKFFEPALYPKERKYILPFIFASVSLFLLGISFCYYVMLPTTLTFLIEMGLEVGTPLITIKDYIHLLLLMVLGFGIVFESPVLIVLLGLLDVVTVESLRKNRRFVIIIIMVLSAILTPSPDPFSQLAMAIPVYGMYEIAIIVIQIAKGRRTKQDEKAA